MNTDIFEDSGLILKFSQPKFFLLNGHTFFTGRTTKVRVPPQTLVVNIFVFFSVHFFVRCGSFFVALRVYPPPLLSGSPLKNHLLFCLFSLTGPPTSSRLGKPQKNSSLNRRAIKRGGGGGGGGGGV